jgi:DNA-binding transcriptional LysR family regulator
MLTHTQLRHVAALARHGNFRQAAAALRISQPALTKGIQTVEAALGVRLFDRAPGPVALTDFGRRVMAHAEAAAAADEDLHRDIALIRGLEAGSTRVVFGPYPSVVSGWASAARLSASHPRLAIALRVAGWREVTNAVAERKADLGVAELSDAVLNDALATELVGRHRARAFCRPGHPILARRRIRIRDLLQFPWVNTRLPPRVAAVLPRLPCPAGRLDELTGEFVPAIELDVPMQLTAFVQDSDALAFGSLGLVERALETGRIAVVSTPGFDIRASYGFIYLRNRSLSPGTLAFMQAVRDEEALVAGREARLESIYC